MPALSLGDLWSPQTDAGVIAQVLITVLLIAVLTWLVRREQALVQLVIGIGMVVLAWYAFRTLH